MGVNAEVAVVTHRLALPWEGRGHPSWLCLLPTPEVSYDPQCLDFPMFSLPLARVT